MSGAGITPLRQLATPHLKIESDSRHPYRSFSVVLLCDADRLQQEPRPTDAWSSALMHATAASIANALHVEEQRCGYVSREVGLMLSLQTASEQQRQQSRTMNDDAIRDGSDGAPLAVATSDR